MRVTALRSFAAIVSGQTVIHRRGTEFDLPVGVDWLQAGLVAPAGAAPHLAGIEHAIDANVVTAERRNAPADRGEALVTDIDGIGPVTARRLAEAGIETLADLLAADPAHVALIASVKASQVEKWRQRAQAVIDGE